MAVFKVSELTTFNDNTSHQTLILMVNTFTGRICTFFLSKAFNYIKAPLQWLKTKGYVLQSFKLFHLQSSDIIVKLAAVIHYS